MMFLYPTLLWLLLPLALFVFKSTPNLQIRTHLLIVILLLLALARPVQESAKQESPIEAKELIIALDVSYSMQASDIAPTRYLFAKKSIKTLLKHNATDNVMLIAFTSNPLLLSPPTTDHALIGVALDALNPQFILTKGTSLKKLFHALAQMHQQNKTLILLTDGGEEQKAQPLADILKQNNITLITVALGTTKGTTLTTQTGKSLKDNKGNLVISRINPMLKKLTSLAQGIYLEAQTTPQKMAKEIEDALMQQTQTQQIEKIQHHYKEYYAIPLFIALVLFFLLHTKGVRYLLILYALLGISLHAGILDGYYLHKAYRAYTEQKYPLSLQVLKKIETPSLQSQMALAAVYYKQGNYKKALEIYHTLHSRSLFVKQAIYYNCANAYAQLGSYAKARQNYVKVLQLGEDNDAKENLKLLLFLTDKKAKALGKSHPQSQHSNAHKTPSQEKETKEKKQEEQQSSGSGSGGESTNKAKTKKTKLLLDKDASKHPLSSKVYELINKGYINETHPW